MRCWTNWTARRFEHVAIAVTGLVWWTSLAPHPAAAMPPPALGNTRGLPAEVRAKLRENPDLFYPKKGFKDVVARQKTRRLELIDELQRQGQNRKAAEDAAIAAITTTRYCPVLCGLYLDKPTPDWPVADLVDQLFSLDYGATNTLGQPGSMREHYRDMSYGTFDVQGGVFGWFPLPQNGAFYYSDDNGLGTDRMTGETGAFLRHTLQASDASVDFRIYDNDGPDNVPNSGDDDGYADLVMFVHPNEGGECGGDDIWSHSFHYAGWPEHAGQPFVTDDVGANGQPIKIDDYVIMPAVSCASGRIEIGVFSHEFGHALGLPDLYDRTAYDPAGAVSTGGMGLYCLMAAGSYGGDYAHAATPTQMCAWSKEEMGWLSPREIVCDETRALYYQGDAPEAIKMWRSGDYAQKEWFLVENRQRKKWDQYLLGSGFLVTHVDNNVTTQNDEACPGGNPCPSAHYQVMVIEADNQWEMQAAAVPVSGPWFGESADFFSAANNADLDFTTTPSSRDHAGAATGVSIHNIGASADKMFADFSVAQTCTVNPLLGLVSSRVTGGCDLDGFVDPGEAVSLAVTIRNFPTAGPATNVTGTLTSLSPTVTVLGGNATFPDLGRGKTADTVIPFRIQGAASAACAGTATLRLALAATNFATTVDFPVQLGLDSLFVPLTPFADDIESGSENGWKHYATINDDDWSHNTNGNHTLFAIPGHSWFSAAPAAGKDISLEPPAFIPSAASVVSFWHRYDTEDNWDGCVLELSTDGGATWIDVGDLTNVGYDDQLVVNPQSTLSGRRAWNGLSNLYPLFEQVTLSLTPWAGQTCILRFRMATDLAATGVAVPGWNIDDYQLTAASVLRQQCETTPLCSGTETTPPVFAGLESATNPGTPACDAVDLKWQAATDASGPLTYLVYAAASSPVATTTPVASTSLLKHRVQGLVAGQTYHFLVRARDSQGNVDANVVEHSVGLACDAPNLVVREMSMDEVVSCDGDDRPDGSERLEMAITVRNASLSNAHGVTATLRSLSSQVQVLASTRSYGDLDAQHYEAANEPFLIRVVAGTPCLTAATLELDITATGGYAVTRTIELVLESDFSLQPQQFFDDIEGVEPNGFSHEAIAGGDDWAYTTSDAHSATHSWFASDSPGVKNIALVSPTLYVLSTSVLSFWHKYILEEGFDGAVLEISTDDGATWTDIGPDYNSSQGVLGPAFGSPFAPGKAFWSGSSAGFVQTTVNLGAMTSPLGEPLYAGQTVQVRWRLGCDDGNTEPPHVGWWIDDIALTDSGVFTTTCDAAGDCATDTPDEVSAPRVTTLAQNHPNPFNPSTTIEYEIAPQNAGHVQLTIYNVAGTVVRRLVDVEQQAGAYRAQWNGRDASGTRVASGIYFYELRAGDQRLMRKLALLQ